MRILVVDDDVVMRLLLGRTLAIAGHEVVEADGGGQGWEVFNKQPVPVVICDWMMPDVDGLEVCRRIRAVTREKYTYIILLTVRSGKENYLEAMAAGADDFLTKPFDRDQLIARLRVAERILGLQDHVKRLEGLLPICSYCKRIRDEDQTWTEIDVYIARRTEATFSHGICPSCYQTIAKPQIERVQRALRDLPASGRA